MKERIFIFKRGKKMNDEMDIKIIGNGDDWEGIYIDGKLKYQNHSINWWDLLKVLGIEFESLYVSEKYLGETVTQLPLNINEIPKKAFIGEENEN